MLTSVRICFSTCESSTTGIYEPGRLAREKQTLDDPKIFSASSAKALKYNHLVLRSESLDSTLMNYTSEPSRHNTVTIKMATQASKPIPYTANPLLLILNDLMLFVQITITWPITAGLPSIVLPLFPMRSGSLDELEFTVSNLWTVVLHVILVSAQILFILSLIPLALVGLPLFYFLYVVGFVVGNQWVSTLLNGPRRQGSFQSHPDCVKGNWPKHEDEKWIFINGVAVG